MLREVELDGVAQQDLELLLRRRAHDTLGDLGSHPRVQLDGVQLLGLLQYPHTDVSRSRADLEDGVGGLEVRLLDDGVCYSRVLEDVLADVCVELEDIVLARGCCAGGLLGRAVVGSRGGRRCAFALEGCFAHVVGGIRAGKLNYLVFITGAGSAWKSCASRCVDNCEQKKTIVFVPWSLEPKIILIDKYTTEGRPLAVG